MKSITYYSMITVFLLGSVSCSKETLDSPLGQLSQSNTGITNFQDYSTSSLGKDEHPYFQALENHRYSFRLVGQDFIDQGGRNQLGLVSANFRATASGHVGNIHFGDYVLKPGTDNYGTEVARITDPNFIGQFGKNVDFVFTGISGELNQFKGSLYVPEMLWFTVPSMDKLREIKPLSRNENFTISYNEDSENDLPILLHVHWSAMGNLDQYRYPVVNNLFLVDDKGTIVLKPEMFKDIPRNAEHVTIEVWRGNAKEDNQGIYFLVSTQLGFTVNLTD